MHRVGGVRMMHLAAGEMMPQPDEQRDERQHSCCDNRTGGDVRTVSVCFAESRPEQQQEEKRSQRQQRRQPQQPWQSRWFHQPFKSSARSTSIDVWLL